MIGLLAALWALDPGAALAPGPPDLKAAAVELERRVVGAEAAAGALSRVHTALAEELRRTGGAPPCDDPLLVALLPRSAPLGMGLRDAAQSARAQAARVATMRTAPTVSSLIDGPLDAQLDALQARVEALEQGYAELSTEAQHLVHPLLQRCPVALAPGRGLSLELPRPASEARRWVAILGQGGGLVCPATGDPSPADGSLVLVPGAACYSATAPCHCTPMPVEAAAVLGPETR